MGQLIVVISREYGSGGHAIATHIADSLGLPLYDRNMLDHMAEKNGIDAEELYKHEEKKFVGLTRTVRGHSTSVQDSIAQIQFDFIREHAASGESFVVVGRCAEHVLKDNPNVVSIFIRGDEAAKVERISRLYKLSPEDAKKKMARHDKNRKAYHNYYADTKWGDSRGYDFCINSSRLGVEKTAEGLYQLIDKCFMDR